MNSVLTFAVFVDGRLVYPATAEILEILIRAELDAHALGRSGRRGP